MQLPTFVLAVAAFAGLGPAAFADGPTLTDGRTGEIDNFHGVSAFDYRPFYPGAAR